MSRPTSSATTSARKRLAGFPSSKHSAWNREQRGGGVRGPKSDIRGRRRRSRKRGLFDCGGKPRNTGKGGEGGKGQTRSEIRSPRSGQLPTANHQPPTINQLSTTNQLRNIRISRIRTLGSWDRIRTVPVPSVAERSWIGMVERSGQTVGTAVHRHRALCPRRRQTHRIRMLHHRREQAKEH